MLDVRDVRKSFGGFTAIGGVSLDVPAQRITAVIGPNGAGKSTLVQSAHRPSACRHRQRLVRGSRHHRRAAARDLPHGHRPLVPAHQYLQEAHRVRECAGRADRAWRRRGRISGAAPQISIATRPGRSWNRSALPIRPTRCRIRSRTATRSRSNSGSRSRAIRSCCCSTSRPPACRRRKRATPSACSSASCAERKLTLLFTEHDMDVVFQIAQKIAVLHQGKLIAEGDPAQVRADADVRRVYLGGRH